MKSKKIPVNTIMNVFCSANSEDIQSLVSKSKNSNTTKDTSQWMRVFNSWTALIGEVRPIYLLSPIGLDKVLQSFYTEVRKMTMIMSQIPLQVYRLILTDI